MLNETTPERSDQMCERADEGPETFASACQFAPNKVWTNPELRKTAFELLDVVQSALEAINVEHCIFYGTLLGTVRQGGPIPWDDKLDLIASRDDWTHDGAQTVEHFDMLLARHSMMRVPFYGGFRVSRVDREQTLHIEGYRHSWPVLNVYLFDKCMQRQREDWTLGIVVQGKPQWCAQPDYQTQWFYEYADVFPARIGQCGDSFARIPRRDEKLLRQDYGEECLDVALPSQWSHRNECYTNYDQNYVPFGLVESLYEIYGWSLYWSHRENVLEASESQACTEMHSEMYDPYEGTQ